MIYMKTDMKFIAKDFLSFCCWVESTSRKTEYPPHTQK